MSNGSKDPRTKAPSAEQYEELQRRLEEAEQTLEAIRHGEVDALVVAGPQGEQVFSLAGAEHVYRVIVETMNEAALMVDPDGTILFCNQRFCDLMKTPIQGVMGCNMTAFAARPQQSSLQALLADAQTGPAQRRLTLRAADGTAVSVQLSASLLRANDSTSICLVASDLTELEASASSVRVLREHQETLQEANERLRVQAKELQTRAEELQIGGQALCELARTLETRVAQRTQELEHRTQQLQKLTFLLSQAEDRERKQLAEVLHEDLQQLLVAATFHLSLLKRQGGSDPARQAIAAKIDQILQDAITKARGLSHELSPAVLQHNNLVVICTWLAGQVRAKHGLMVRVDAFREVMVQSDALKALLYKAAQEMLLNVVKHARVNEARIRVRRVGRCVCLSVSDHGRGFDPRKLKETAGFGLLNIRERIELLGGRMKINSARGKGGTLHIVVPDGESPGPDVRVKARPNGRTKRG